MEFCVLANAKRGMIKKIKFVENNSLYQSKIEFIGLETLYSSLEPEFNGKLKKKAEFASIKLVSA